MMRQAGNSPRTVAKVKRSCTGLIRIRPVWALAMLNMFFRGDGKSNVVRGSCFEEAHQANVREKFTRAYLNPPFSQEDEPERDFIDAALEALEPGGELAVVVKAGIFGSTTTVAWREELNRRSLTVGGHQPSRRPVLIPLPPPRQCWWFGLISP